MTTTMWGNNNTMSTTALSELQHLSTLVDQPISEFRDAIIEALCALTESEIAYFYATDASEENLTLLGYSKSVMENCAIVQRPGVYRVADTGLWGDAIRERKPIITNDYPNSKRPSKRGYPEGHVHVQSHMNLPIIVDDRVVSLVGVGNKRTPYTLDDAARVESLMLGIWEHFQEALWQATW